ncbi:hypothetical protein TNCV_4749431 [Trichonephila clavipes]|nr:hypothetical protein TNCV_4749431 [Trichonephila clavipes]
MGHEDELTTEELQEFLNEEHQETQRNVSPSEQEEDERGPMPTSAIKDLLKIGRIILISAHKKGKKKSFDIFSNLIQRRHPETMSRRKGLSSDEIANLLPETSENESDGGDCVVLI